ncbi:uncharacterized protein LOC100829388 isoform X3 [Brachypodium distachyon]|nr:uncharacterized protein LOC100829388 isoform X3 [Brachypodium distachyon]KQK03795.1 hypothetical protein BRADI_2g09890v3 [Brachypodium distachyon]KQK03797.1 hypothetical protein BRADI_2g09890v3 [Brachypodium distachyon]|eukprot:XP_010230757.1 uncharacterized protein LOC100829388 isoform X3 [Brachypodium distachyon]
MQSVAAEFNLSETAFLARDSSRAGAAAPRFHLRWFTPVAEVELCGHATLASAHFLFTTVLADHGVVEFMTMSGILTARKVPASDSTGVLGEEQAKPFIELDFPMIDFVDCNSSDKTPSIPKTLNGASIVSVHESAMDGDLIVELLSGKEVVDMLPNTDEIRRLVCRGLIVTGPTPAGSGYDFFTRYFSPKFGIDEDPVTGSVHCVLAPYWGKKLGKQKLTAFQASSRGGTLYLELKDENQRVRIQGEAVTVMVGTLLA